jgi:hypothetical protein
MGFVHAPLFYLIRLPGARTKVEAGIPQILQRPKPNKPSLMLSFCLDLPESGVHAHHTVIHRPTR